MVREARTDTGDGSWSSRGAPIRPLSSRQTLIHPTGSLSGPLHDRVLPLPDSNLTPFNPLKLVPQPQTDTRVCFLDQDRSTVSKAVVAVPLESAHESAGVKGAQ